MKTLLQTMALATGLTLCLAQEPAQPLDGAVVEVVTGEASITTDGKALPITKGQVLNKGHVIQTGKGGLLLLKLRNKGELIVYENSRIELKSEPKKPAKIRLLQTEGFTWTRMPKLRNDQSFHVDMPAATAGIRGTAFSARVGRNKSSQVCVCEGAVTMETDEGEFTLKQGELASAESGKPVERPTTDLKFLKHPTRETQQCLKCHQGGYSRDGRY